MVDVIGWLLRVFEPTRAARCTACGKRATGILVGEPPFDYIVCENCKKSWNISPSFENHE